MELNDPIRNRRVGFLGVAVATLLTPGGKLFTSAMAAATLGVAGVALLAKDDPTSTGKSAAPAIAQTSTALNGAELLALKSELPASESGYDLLTATPSNSPVPSQVIPSTFQSSINGGSNMSAVNIPAPTIPLSNGIPVIVIGAGFPQAPESDEPPALPELADPPKPDFIAKPSGKPNDVPPDEIIIVEAFPENDPLSGPDVLPASPPPPDDEKNPLVTDAGLPGIQSPLSTAALPIPSTLGLFLLGLASLGWLYRRRAD